MKKYTTQFKNHSTLQGTIIISALIRFLRFVYMNFRGIRQHVVNAGSQRRLAEGWGTMNSQESRRHRGREGTPCPCHTRAIGTIFPRRGKNDAFINDIGDIILALCLGYGAASGNWAKGQFTGTRILLRQLNIMRVTTGSMKDTL